MPVYDLIKPSVHMLINDDLKTKNVKLNLILQYVIPQSSISERKSQWAGSTKSCAETIT